VAQARAQAIDGHQEGSRWINKRPSGAEVAKWFVDNAPMHEGMDPKRYVAGVTLIPAKEKVRIAERNQAGATVIKEVEQLVYTPYVKVETRVAYFWDLMLERGWLGVIEPADVQRLETEGYRNTHLPPGFFRMPIKKADGKAVSYLACSQQVRVYEPDLKSGGRGRLVMQPPPGTKMVAELAKWGEDPFVVMKAETGAVGRALGMAGMLVLPGSGVATAEDMLEVAGAEATASSPEVAQLPEEPGAAAAAPAGMSAGVRERIGELSARLESENPGGFEELVEWAKERKVDLNDLKEPQLRGVLRQIERRLS